MPLYKDLSDDVTKILIWEFDENEELDSDLLLEPENQAKILGYHPHKIAEVLMIRKRILYLDNTIFSLAFSDLQLNFLSPETLYIIELNQIPYS